MNLRGRMVKCPKCGYVEPIHLTTRESETLKWLVEGFSNREIAEKMGVQERTAKAHMHGIMHKIGVKNRIQVVAYWYEVLLPSTTTNANVTD